MKETMRRPLPIEVLPYLRDHRAGGKTVLPAVEALQRLASSTQGYFPGIYILAMYHASFPRFLLIEPDDHIVDAYNEIETDDDGNLKTKLVTVSVSKRMKIAISRTYAQVCFKKNAPDLPGKDISFSLQDDETFNISEEKLYQDLVPLGPSYQNAYEPIRLGRRGATARLRAPTLPAPIEPLGSPFPFDAAMHCACAWSQRFYGIVAFPVGFDWRIIYNRTRPGENYGCRIVPVSSEKGTLIFDIRIYHEEGFLCEFIAGIKMQDVTAGRLSPPLWIRDIA